MVEVPRVIVCVDCGEAAHLVSYPPEEREWEPGDLTTYRCEACHDRWDLIVPDTDEGEAPLG
jgi:hypothetical protein